ncbi:MAG: ABC transporter ATP-binding protein [Dialister sp.]|nr:ABC transporter ATP-binding protein [Dialister sp.]
MLKVVNLTHGYPDGEGTLTALRVPHLEAHAGEAWCITGPSGSGKSTLLHCLSGLLHPTSGEISYDGLSLTSGISAGKLDTFRAHTIGYLYQKFNLLPFLTARDNILLGAYWGDVKEEDAEKRLAALAKKMGIASLLNHHPDAMSQGEQQRAALARALIKKPPILLADEPTANLDADNSRIVISLLKEYAEKENALLFVASHDAMVIESFSHILPLSKGGAHD